MKRLNIFNHALARLILGMGLLHAVSPRVAADVIGVEYTPKTIRGKVTLTNQDMGILSILEGPDGEGVRDVSALAQSVAPAESLSSVGVSLAEDRLSNPYAITVSSSTDGIQYDVSAHLSVDREREEYYTGSVRSPLMTSAGSDVELNFAECAGMLRLSFVDVQGNPVQVHAMRGQVIEVASGSVRGTLNGTYDSTENYLLVPADVEFKVDLQIDVGTDGSADRVTYSRTLTQTVGCDSIVPSTVVLDSLGTPGSMVGLVDLVGEFELFTVGSGEPAGRTAVSAVGPSNIRRYQTVPGDNVLVPASGPFTLANLPASDNTDPSVPYDVYAEMHLGRIPNFEYFISPHLLSGQNVGVTVPGGQTVDLGNTFVMQPGYISGHLSISGPPETPDQPSGLRALYESAIVDEDGDGIYDYAGTYGVTGPFVQLTGVDRLAEGATYTASGGLAEVGFPAAFQEATSSLEGDYRAIVGGLRSESSIWKADNLHLSFYSDGQGATPYMYEEVTITDLLAPELEMAPQASATHNIDYHMSEICIRFRSTDTPFYSPRIRFSQGRFETADGANRPRQYTVYLDSAFGAPATTANAAKEGLVVLYLPQGTYDLVPYVTSVLPDQTESEAQLPMLHLTVGDRQRICIESCLQVELTGPSCPSADASFNAKVSSCDLPVTRMTYQVNQEAPVELCQACGNNPVMDFRIPLINEDSVVVVTAYAESGAVSSASVNVAADRIPPSIVCPPDIVTVANSGCGTAVPFEVQAHDNCSGPATVHCDPPSGSVFAVGTHVVMCEAMDPSGNTAQCSFQVTVTPSTSGGANVISVEPGLATTAGGTLLTVRGDGLTPEQTVTVGGLPLQNLVFVNSHELQGVSPALSEGSYAVALIDCGGVVSQWTGSLRVGTIPTLFSVDPKQVYARGGTQVLIRGANLVPETQVSIAFPDGVGAGSQLLANVVVASDGLSLTGDVPPLPQGQLFGPRNVVAADARGTSTLVAGVQYVPNPTETDPQVVSLRTLEAASVEPPSIAFRNGFPVGMNIRVPTIGTNPEERARNFIRTFAPLLRLWNADAELETRSVLDADVQHVKFAQRFQGVPVFGGQVVLSLVGDEVLTLSGALASPEAWVAQAVQTQPTLSGEAAESIARTQLQLPQSPLQQPSVLQLFDESLLRATPSAPHLVWRVWLKGAADELFIDAQTGDVVFRLPVAEDHGGDLEGFDLDLQDAEEEANAQDDWCFNLSNDTDVADEDDFNSDYNNDPDAVQLNIHARNAYRYFHRDFNWHSYDNDESQIELFIHATIANGPNAQWVRSCELIQFSTGMIDYEVMVHELTHGVIYSTSDLIYQFESGALNESYADTMGVIADREAGDLNWNLGENRTGFPGVAVRSMQSPTIDRRSKYLSVPGNNDSGGVHSNSGIGNKTVYLMTEGGDFNGRRVRHGMGLTKTRDLKWEALRALPNNAGYDAARAMEVGIAIGWAKTGAHGFTAEDVCTVRNAWAAVEVGNPDFNCDGVEEKYQDADKDYIPDAFDNCRLNANPGQEDVDHDGVGDVCDNCRNAWNPDQKDTDLDGKGDVCDEDIDNDGCKNEVDQHPYDSMARIGTALAPLCPGGNHPIYGFEGVDTDHDGLLDCEDLDDDNDGIPDDQDSCPVGPLKGAIDGCSVLEDCPVSPKDWWRLCLGGGCNEVIARFRDVINPNPESDILIDQVRISGKTLYLFPNVGSTALQTARSISGKGQVRLADAQSQWRVELWTKGDASQPSHLVAVVGEYDPSTLQTGTLNLGQVLAFTPGENQTPSALDTVWYIGSKPEDNLADSDQDGLPDGWEVQHGLSPRNPLDADRDDDGDGVSNRDEYDMGTDPQNPSSVFRILQMESRDSGVRLQIQSVVGRSFQLQRSPRLEAGLWENVGDRVSGDGSVLILSDSTATSVPSAFYRVMSKPE